MNKACPCLETVFSLLTSSHLAHICVLNGARWGWEGREVWKDSVWSDHEYLENSVVCTIDGDSEIWHHERRPLTFRLNGIPLAIPMHTIFTPFDTQNQYINLYLYWKCNGLYNNNRHYTFHLLNSSNRYLKNYLSCCAMHNLYLAKIHWKNCHEDYILQKIGPSKWPLMTGAHATPTGARATGGTRGIGIMGGAGGGGCTGCGGGPGGMIGPGTRGTNLHAGSRTGMAA